MVPSRSVFSCFPRLYAAASLKLYIGQQLGFVATGFPRLYAAASLKHGRRMMTTLRAWTFSAALCRGLIEARFMSIPPLSPAHGFPRLYAAASLKPVPGTGVDESIREVFRGFMPRPH